MARKEKKPVHHVQMTEGKRAIIQQLLQEYANVKHFFTEAYHRPHRLTWEDMEEIRKALTEELGEDAPDELKEYLAVLNSMEEGNDEDQELKRLLSSGKTGEKRVSYVGKKPWMAQGEGVGF